MNSTIVVQAIDALPYLIKHKAKTHAIILIRNLYYFLKLKKNVVMTYMALKIDLSVCSLDIYI